MSVQEIEKAIIKLPPGDLADLVEWLDDYQAASWDRQIAQDSKAGRFEALIDRAREQRKIGQCKPL
jgi:hypothetical protein